MKAFFVGRRQYQEVLRFQELVQQAKVRRQLAIQRKETQLPLLPDVVVLVEHATPVYTLGRRDTTEGLPSPCSVEVVKTRRGGGITYHGPGQLTMYPIANIQNRWRRCTAEKVRSPIEWFSAVLEQAMMDTVMAYGIPTHRFKTGVWSEAHGDAPAMKIGSIGLQLSSWVTMHGVGLNVCPELTYFDNIVMCELPGKRATSIHQQCALRGQSAEPPTVQEVAPALLSHLVRNMSQPPDEPTVLLEDFSSTDQWERAVQYACEMD